MEQPESWGCRGLQARVSDATRSNPQQIFRSESDAGNPRWFNVDVQFVKKPLVGSKGYEVPPSWSLRILQKARIHQAVDPRREIHYGNL